MQDIAGQMCESIGELKQSENLNDYKKELLWLCGHAREVFASQPTRIFLHGFVIHGSVVELWVLINPDHTAARNLISI
jgi:Fungal protein kinase